VTRKESRPSSQACESPGIQDNGSSRLTIQNAVKQMAAGVLIKDPRTNEDGIAAGDALRQESRRLRMDLSGGRLWQADDKSLRKREPQLGREATAGADLQLSRSGAQRGGSREEGSSWDRDAASDHKHASPLFFVAILRGKRKRNGVEILWSDLPTTHRAATLASGSEVTGAPASSRGATKL